MDIRTVKSNVFISGYPMGEKLMDATGSTSSATACARLGRSASPSECCELITTTVNSSDLVSCRACPSGRALMGTARIGKQEAQDMANGKCECCGATAVMYRHGGVSRCYSCHKTKAEPMDMPGEKKADEAPAPVHTCLPTDKDGHTMMAMQDVPEVETALAPSWDDFEDLSPVLRNHPRAIFFAVQTGGKCALSGALADTIGAKAGSMVLVRKGVNRLAIRLLTEPERGALKLTPGKSGQGRLAFGGRTILAQVPLEKGRYAVDVVPWGCIVKTDEPMPVPGKA